MNLTMRALFLNWIAVYPTITILLATMGPMLSDWPLPLKTLAISALMVPLTAAIALPIAKTAFGRLLIPQRIGARGLTRCFSNRVRRICNLPPETRP